MCSRPTDMKTNVSSDHMKANLLQNINHPLHHIYQCGILYRCRDLRGNLNANVHTHTHTHRVKQIIKKHPFPCNTHTQISPLASHPKPLGAHFLIILAFLSFPSGRKQWMASRALCVFSYLCWERVSACSVCMYLCVHVCVCSIRSSSP